MAKNYNDKELYKILFRISQKADKIFKQNINPKLRYFSDDELKTLNFDDYVFEEETLDFLKRIPHIKVLNLPYNAFYFKSVKKIDLTNLTNLQIIGENFLADKSYLSPSYNNNGLISDVILPDSVNEIKGGFLFGNSKFVTNFKFPKNLTKIGSDFLQGVVDIQKVIFNKKIETIGDYFLFSTKTIQDPLILPLSLHEIGNKFLCSCLIKDIILPPNLSNVGTGFFGESPRVKIQCTENVKQVVLKNNPNINPNLFHIKTDIEITNMIEQNSVNNNISNLSKTLNIEITNMIEQNSINNNISNLSKTLDIDNIRDLENSLADAKNVNALKISWKTYQDDATDVEQNIVNMIKNFTNISSLYLFKIENVKLDFSVFPNLKNLEIAFFKSDFADIQQLRNLESIKIRNYYTNQKKLDLLSFTNLVNFKLLHSDVNKIIFPKNSKLQYLRFRNSFEIDFTNLTQLKKVAFIYLPFADFSKCSNLELIDFDSFETIDISNCINLVNIRGYVPVQEDLKKFSWNDFDVAFLRTNTHKSVPRVNDVNYMTVFPDDFN